MNIEEIAENFELLEGWEDRYRYIIELGEKLPPLALELHTDERKIPGCLSQVWIAPEAFEGRLLLKGDSDAAIVKGIMAIVFAVFENKSAKEILEVEAAEIFDRLGLQDHLSPSRRSGLAAMVAAIKAQAQGLL